MHQCSREAHIIMVACAHGEIPLSNTKVRETDSHHVHSSHNVSLFTHIDRRVRTCISSTHYLLLYLCSPCLLKLLSIYCIHIVSRSQTAIFLPLRPPEQNGGLATRDQHMYVCSSSPMGTQGNFRERFN